MVLAAFALSNGETSKNYLFFNQGYLMYNLNHRAIFFSCT